MRSEISKVVRVNGCLNMYTTFQLVVLGILVDRRAWQVRLGESISKSGARVSFMKCVLVINTLLTYMHLTTPVHF